MPVASSARLGIQVLADAAPWCGPRPAFTVVAEEEGAFRNPDVLTVLQRLGTALVAKECPAAAGLTLAGTVRGSAAVAWRAAASAAGGWSVQAAAPAALDLDAAPPAPAPAPAAPAVQVVSPAPGGLSVSVLGRRVVLAPKPDLSHAVLVDGRAVGRGESDRAPTIADARVVAGSGYVLVSQPNSGTACPGGSYYLLIVGPASVTKTADFGTCSEAVPAIAAAGQGWSAEADGPGPEQRTAFTVEGAAGSARIVERTRTVPTPAAGPAAGDIRALLAGQSPSGFVKLRLADDAVRAAVPPGEYARLRGLLLSGPQTEFARRGDYLVGWGCRAHSCDTEDVRLAFGPDNRAFVQVYRDGRRQVFGGPPPEALRLLAAADKPDPAPRPPSPGRTRAIPGGTVQVASTSDGATMLVEERLTVNSHMLRAYWRIRLGAQPGAGRSGPGDVPTVSADGQDLFTHDVTTPRFEAVSSGGGRTYVRLAAQDGPGAIPDLWVIDVSGAVPVATPKLRDCRSPDFAVVDGAYVITCRAGGGAPASRRVFKDGVAR